MQATFRKSKVDVTQFATSPELVEWICSAAGQSAVHSAVKDSQLAVYQLSESRKIQPEQLHVPITL